MKKISIEEFYNQMVEHQIWQISGGNRGQRADFTNTDLTEYAIGSLYIHAKEFHPSTEEYNSVMYSSSTKFRFRGVKFDGTRMRLGMYNTIIECEDMDWHYLRDVIVVPNPLISIDPCTQREYTTEMNRRAEENAKQAERSILQEEDMYGKHSQFTRITGK